MRIFDAVDLNDAWQIYRQTDDETGTDAAPGHLLGVLNGTCDGVDIHFWQRDADIGPLNPAVAGDVIETKFDIVFAGEVDITDGDGHIHHVQAGQAILYRSDELGHWEQIKPIVKIGITLKNFRLPS
ncbi:hypothetical protein [Agrobacterium sp. ICMP 6402]|uniref:hypothetical protein n=1 Tax=Agrobacterium sp. ICMP 6402 TaxID=2292443 RepID=UPI001297D993|nr:hypothetical protein [Agrobacterium sp. ICMP 6402]